MSCSYTSVYGEGCQFPDLPDEETLTHEGRYYCPFHAPMDATGDDGHPKSAWTAIRVGNFNDRVLGLIKQHRRHDSPNMTGVVFPGKIRFSGHHFAGITFNLATFADIVKFDHTTFADSANFIGTTFANNAHFEFARFHEAAWFKDARFCNQVWFEGAAFNEHARFGGVRFVGLTAFRSVLFSNEADFDGAHFLGEADFRKANFKSAAHFRGAKFGGGATFWGVTFMGAAWFDRARFCTEASFDGGTFSGEASFKHAAFDSAAVFSVEPIQPKAEFHRISFAESRFGSSADFTNRRFLQAADFQNAIFQNAPLFHGATLHQGTNFTGAQFLDRTGDATPAYRTLKLAMAGMRARDEEGLFAALEHECRRKRADTPRLVKLLSLVYGWTSVYGLSLARPVLWLLALTLAFAIVYLAAFVKTPSWPLCYSDEEVWETARFTATQLFRPFDAFGAGRPDLYRSAVALARPSLVLAVLAAFQSVASLTLIALFLLALRWRFKRD